MRDHVSSRFFSIVATIVSACAVIAMCVLIFVMSSMPADDSTELSMGVVWHIIGFIVPGYDQMTFAEQLQWQQMLDHPVRKVAHFLEYALLGAFMMNLAYRIARLHGDAATCRGDCTMPSVSFSQRSIAIGAWVVATAYAITDEIHQIFVPGRACMVTDVLIDSVGVLVGVLVVAAAIRALRKSSAMRECSH